MASRTAPAAHTRRSSRDQSTRDPLLDLARTGALVVVVLWHWVFSTVEVNDTGLHVSNVLGAAPWLWFLTWILQPMAIFFAVGGSLHLASWRRNPDRFVRRRVRQLALPALPLLVPAALVILLGELWGAPLVSGAALLIISPLWFLAVYLVLVTLVPLTAAMHERSPRMALVGLLCAAVAIDLGRFGAGWGGPTQIVAGFVVVWAAVHQLGYWWDRLVSLPVSVRAAVACSGLVAMMLLPKIGPYPLAMVGYPGEQISNMAPPNLMTLALGVAHIGMLALFADPLRRLATRFREVLGTAQAKAMGVFVWHLAGYTVFFALAIWGIGLDNEHITPTWWTQRWMWLAGPAAVTALILSFWSRPAATSRGWA